MQVLVTRVKAVLRRATTQAAATTAIGKGQLYVVAGALLDVETNELLAGQGPEPARDMGETRVR